MIKNTQLLMDIAAQFKVARIGTLGAFFDVSPDWRCPCCYRSKPEIARLDQNGNLLCSIVRHHDHFGDAVRTALRASHLGGDYGLIDAHVTSFTRFSPTLICNDCNVIDHPAKRLVNAPKYFSFAPYEIATFVSPIPNEGHDCAAIKRAELQYAFRCAIPTVLHLLDRLKSIVRPEDERGLGREC